jgi:hypothetical protein
VQNVACAWCLSLVTASLLAATGPPQVAGAGSTRGAAAPSRGHQGQTVGRPGGHSRPTSQTRPSRLISTLADGLPSRRFAPWFGALVGAEPLVLPDPEQALGSTDGERVTAPIPRGAYPEPSSIQPLESMSDALTRAGSSATGTLRLDVEPRTAQVYIDGFYVGIVEAVNANGGLIVDAGWHRLEFRAPGYQTPAVNVTVAANRAIVLRLMLRPIV